MAEESAAEQGVADQDVADQAREAVLHAIVTTAAKIGNSPAGVRDLAEAYALLVGRLPPNVGVVHNKS
ncbi:MAG: hypothetical protein QOK35_1900 [Pseudonocardiales bacterium]|jgi:hypothetical protein|nr:hypothetical protein [Pseudonocardiales bacterium]